MLMTDKDQKGKNLQDTIREKRASESLRELPSVLIPDLLQFFPLYRHSGKPDKRAWTPHENRSNIAPGRFYNTLDKPVSE